MSRPEPFASTLEVLYDDEHLVVAVKPAGLLAVPGRGADKADCCSRRLQARWPALRVVHRLDMATSGLMLFAIGPEIERVLARAFAERHVAKRYIAVVHGAIAADTGEIALPLAADWPRRPLQKVDRLHGKPSLTRWRVLAHDDGRTRVDLEPVTGRSHQLRVHLQAIGHPIVGDALYGPPDAAPRLLLHASALAFAHPAHGQAMAFESAPPF